MSTSWIRIAVGCAALAGLALPIRSNDTGPITELGWMSGCWASLDGEDGSGELWMAPAGGTMIGVARTIRGSETVSFEHLLIRTSPAGRLEYVAKPSGQSETVFSLVDLGEKHVVFENPEHDFPQRVLYRLEEDGNLRARIEGPSKEGIRGIDFPMKPVSCRESIDPAEAEGD